MTLAQIPYAKGPPRAFRANRDEAVRAIVVTTWGPPRHARCSIGSLTLSPAPRLTAPYWRGSGGAARR
jgi:hypothetical protein